MPISLQTITDLDFSHSHSITLNVDVPNFVPLLADANTSACVYMWLSRNGESEEFDVLYVGKAGFGVERRMRQHQSGFVHSTTGRQNRQLILDWMQNGRTIDVYRRVSEIRTLLGHSISLYSAEEQALCERFTPLWNRAKFPQVAALQAQEELVAVEPPAGALPEEQIVHAINDVNLTPDLNVNFNDLTMGDEVVAFVDALEPTQHAQFMQLLELLQNRDPNANQKIVRGYAAQPAGYNDKPMYVFGRIGNDGRARYRPGWIPLVNTEESPLTVILPENAMSPNIDRARLRIGPRGDWCPMDLTHFLANVDLYLI